MKLLKQMIENMVNENEDNAKVNFHSYLTTKMSALTEMDMDMDKYEEKVQIPNEKVSDYLEAGKGLYSHVKFEVVKEDDFHTTIKISCHDENKLKKAIDLADDFK